MAQVGPSGHSWRSPLAIDRIRYGEQISFSNLTLIPLFTHRPAPVAYVILSKAIRTGAGVGLPPSKSRIGPALGRRGERGQRGSPEDSE